MTPLKIGGRDVKAVKIGSRDIVRIMLGTREIWAAEEPPGEACDQGIIVTEPTWGQVTGVGQAGYEFQVWTGDLEVCALRHYRISGLPAAETVRIWRVSDSELVASATFGAGTGWQEQAITPVVLEAGERYRLTRRISGGSARNFGRLDSATDIAAVHWSHDIAFVAGVNADTDAYPGSTPTSIGRVDVLYKPLPLTDPVIEYGVKWWNSTSVANSSQQSGYAFTPQGDQKAIGARIYLNAAGAETARLWRVSDEALLASVAITSVSGQWVAGMFTTPVVLEDGESYVIATRRTDGSNRSRHVSSVGNSIMNTRRLSFDGGVFQATNGFPAVNSTSLGGVADIILEIEP